MVDCRSVVRAVRETEDPRVWADAVDCHPGDSDRGSVLVVGVVHDHPASLYRVAHVLERVTPSALGLELPPLAVPLFRVYARDDHTPPRLGGEMSLAIRTAGRARPVGIDGPSVPYLGLLARRLLGEGGDAGAVASDTLATGRQALVTRAGAVLARHTSLRPRLYTHLTYEVTLLDDPAAQAAHERAHLERQRAFLRAVSPPATRRLIDDVREETMVRRLRELRSLGDVAAVVGMEHLEPLRAALDPER